jgi:hypothetical protein
MVLGVADNNITKLLKRLIGCAVYSSKKIVAPIWQEIYEN